MEYLKQNASGLFTEIQKIGCYFRAALHMAEMQAAKEGKDRRLSLKDINQMWWTAKRLKYINKENNVVNSAAIANLARDRLGLKGRFYEVATFVNGEMCWYQSVKDRHSDYYIQKIAQGGPSKTHFINVDKFGVLLWDPHDPVINKTGVYYTVCYQYSGGDK